MLGVRSDVNYNITYTAHNTQVSITVPQPQLTVQADPYDELADLALRRLQALPSKRRRLKHFLY
jgi:hypothetical protein